MAGNLSRSGLDAIRAAAQRHVADDNVPGLVALVASGDQVHVEALGRLSAGGPPVARDSLFRIASTTKPITGAATLALVAEGLVGLDEPVDQLLPELANRQVLREMGGPLDDTVPATRPITTRDLLTFTFGFGMSGEMFTAAGAWPVVIAAEELSLVAFGPPDPAIQPDPHTWIGALGSLPLMAQPGERWLYNTGALVLGVLLGRAAGTSCGEVLRTRIFEPVGMSSTGFWTSDTDRMAEAYRPGPDGLVPWDAQAGGAGRSHSKTAAPAWCLPSTTCSRSPGCSCTTGAVSCRRPPLPRCAPISSRRRRRRTADSARTSSPASRGRSARPCVLTARSAGTAVSAPRGWSTRSGI